MLNGNVADVQPAEPGPDGPEEIKSFFVNLIKLINQNNQADKFCHFGTRTLYYQYLSIMIYAFARQWAARGWRSIYRQARSIWPRDAAQLAAMKHLRSRSHAALTSLELHTYNITI